MFFAQNKDVLEKPIEHVNFVEYLFSYICSILYKPNMNYVNKYMNTRYMYQ